MDLVFTVVVPSSLALITFALGLGLTIDDFRNVARRPKAFFAGATAQLILVPVAAYIIIVMFRVPAELAVGIMVLSLCPGGPTTNMLTRIGLGDLALSVSLSGVLSLVAVITVPILTAFFAQHFLELEAPPVNVTQLGLTVSAITLIPVGLGMFIRTRLGNPDKLEQKALLLAGLLFFVIILGALVANWALFVAYLSVLGPAMATLAAMLLCVGLIIGRLLSLKVAEATSISVDTGIQNATLGMTVGLVLAGNAIGSPFTMPSIIYGILMYFLAVPFVLWRRRRAASNLE